MAKPGYVGANVVVGGGSTFRSWLNVTNQIIYDMSTIVLTTEANSVGATTTGNAHVNGIFSAVTLVAGTTLRGGTVAAGANLTIGSNVAINAASFSSVANAIFSNGLYSTGAFVANAGATLGPNVSITNALTANQAIITGAKSFGALSSISFTDFANNSNNGKFFKQNNNGLILAEIPLNDLSDVDAGSPSIDQYLKWDGSNWVPSAITSGGSFSSNSISANNLAAVFNAQLGALSTLGNTGYAVNVFVNSTASVVEFKSNTVSFANSNLVNFGSTSNLRVTGGANNQFLQTTNSTNGNVAWTTVDKDFIFPAAAVTTIGANVFSIDLTNNRVGFGTNSVPSSYIVGFRGNVHANGSGFITGDLSVGGNVASTNFIGALVGLASNASALNGKSDAYFQNSSNQNTGTLPAARLPFSMDQNVATTSNVTFSYATLTGIIPSANGAPLGNTLRRMEVFGNTGNFSAGITVGANSDFGNNSVTGMRIKNYKEHVETIGSIATNSVAINLANSNIFDLTLANNSIAVTFSNPPSSGNAYSTMLVLRQDATGGRAVTWPASVKWPNGTAPTLATGASALSILSFMTIDGGATYWGSLNLGNLS